MCISKFSTSYLITFSNNIHSNNILNVKRNLRLFFKCRNFATTTHYLTTFLNTITSKLGAYILEIKEWCELRKSQKNNFCSY